MGNSGIPGIVYLDSKAPVLEKIPQALCIAEISGKPAPPYIQESAKMREGADSSQEKVRMKIKLGRDGRDRIQNTKSWPYSPHG